MASRSLHKGTMMAGNNRKKSYGLLLLLALGAAFLSVIVLQKLRERRVLGLLLQDREHELLAFELHLQVTIAIKDFLHTLLVAYMI